MDDIRYTYEVPVPVDVAYDQFVHGIAKWWPHDHTHPGRELTGPNFGHEPGDYVTATVDGQTVTWGEMLTIEAPYAIAWRNWWRQSQARATQVHVSFMEVEYGTRVVVRQTGWNDSNATDRERFRDWPLIISNFISSARTSDARLSRHV